MDINTLITDIAKLAIEYNNAQPEGERLHTGNLMRWAMGELERMLKASGATPCAATRQAIRTALSLTLVYRLAGIDHAPNFSYEKRP